MGFMQTILLVEKLTFPTGFYKDYPFCSLEYLPPSLVTVLSSYVLEGYPCHLTSQLEPCSFPCSKNNTTKSGPAPTPTSHQGEEAVGQDIWGTSPALSSIAVNDYVNSR